MVMDGSLCWWCFRLFGLLRVCTIGHYESAELNETPVFFVCGSHDLLGIDATQENEQLLHLEVNLYTALSGALKLKTSL